MICLHIGCGKRFISGFTHIDIDDFPHVDHRSRVDKLDFIEESSVDLVYACHVLEYFDRFEAVEVLREWKRILKPGGICRISVPDLDALIKVYKGSGNLEKIIGPLFGRMEIDVQGEKKYIYHKTVFDCSALKGVFEQADFSNVSYYDWKETDHAGVDDFSQAYYPHMDKENGVLISLNMQANKRSNNVK